MKGSIETIKNRIYELSLRIDKETYNQNGSRSEIKKLVKQKSKLERQLEKISRQNIITTASTFDALWHWAGLVSFKQPAFLSGK